MKRTLPRLLPLLLALSGGPMAGCAVDGDDLAAWEHVAEGEGRLAAYLADPARPVELRARALAVLLKMRAIDHIMGVLKVASPEQRAVLLKMYATAIVTILTKMHTQDEKEAAATLGYDVLEHVDALKGGTDGTGEARDRLLVDTLVDWCLGEMLKPGDERARPGRKLEDILLAALAVRPEVAGPRIADRMRAAGDADELLAINALLAKVEDPAIRASQAQHLLDFARRVYPAVPPDVARAMIANRNETVLRFLLDAARDPRVPPETRRIGLIEAAAQLKHEALGGLMLVLAADDPKHSNIMRVNALDLAWDHGGVERLADALQALPPSGTWWPDGVQFRVFVDGFCDTKLAPAKDAARPVLERLVDDPNWVTRTYAMRCVERLYPDAAAELLAPLLEDETPLPGWSAEGEVTLGSHAAAVIEAAEARAEGR